jgi:hypothetical protein
VKIKAIFEGRHLPMRHWLQAIFLTALSKNGKKQANQSYLTKISPSGSKRSLGSLALTWKMEKNSTGI